MDLDQRLKDAAESGDTSVLYSLIREDPYILKRLDGVPYVDTPLHTAARLGHLSFVREIMRLKPSFAKKPNQEGLYPVHLATAEGRFKVLRALLSSERGLARLQGREGKTPLHYAAEKGDLLLLDTILSACPQSMQDVTDRSETALHIAIKFSNFDAFYFLLRKLRTAYHEGSAEEERSILNFQDQEGNTVLHIALSMNQHELVKQLLRIGAKLDKKNAQGLTAKDVLAEVQGRENAEAIRRILTNASYYHVLDYILHVWDRQTIKLIRYKKDIPIETRGLLLVVIVLIATVTYQAAVNPPSNINDDKHISLILNFTANSSTPNNTVHYCSLDTTRTNNNNNMTTEALNFWIFNIIGLLSSMISLILLLPGKYLRSLLYVPLYFFTLLYAMTIEISGSLSLSLITIVLSAISLFVLDRVNSVRERYRKERSVAELGPTPRGFALE